jgi:hypothetical protein
VQSRTEYAHVLDAMAQGDFPDTVTIDLQGYRWAHGGLIAVGFGAL